MTNLCGSITNANHLDSLGTEPITDFYHRSGEYILSTFTLFFVVTDCLSHDIHTVSIRVTTAVIAM